MGFGIIAKLRAKPVARDPFPPAAKALHDTLGFSEGWPHPECDECVAALRAVLEAIREPSEAMLKAAAAQQIGGHYRLDMVWRAMVDVLIARS